MLDAKSLAKILQSSLKEASGEGLLMELLEAASYSACGKVILFGEHFVVHGAPALAVPFKAVQTTIRIKKSVRDEAPRLIAEQLTNQVFHTQLAEKLLEHALLRLGQAALEMSPSLVSSTNEPGNSLANPDWPSANFSARGWSIIVDSTLPLGSGLGSSAAFAVALFGALFSAAGIPLTPDKLNEHAFSLEKIVHGTPSGIDNTVIVYRRPVWFIKGEPVRLLDARSAWRLVLFSGGEPRKTAEAIAKVKAFKDSKTARFESLCQSAQAIAERGLSTMQAGLQEELGVLIDKNHRLLQELDLSTPAMERLISAARAAGAWGAKLTGAGCGGFALALVADNTEEKVVQALEGAGAKSIFRTTI